MSSWRTVGNVEEYSADRFDNLLAEKPDLVLLYKVIFEAIGQYTRIKDPEGYAIGLTFLGNISFEVQNNKLSFIKVQGIADNSSSTVFKSPEFSQLKNLDELLTQAFHCDPCDTSLGFESEVLFKDGSKKKEKPLYCQTYGQLYTKSQELPHMTLLYKNDTHKETYTYRFDYLNHRSVLDQYSENTFETDIYDFLHRRPFELTVPRKPKVENLENEEGNKTQKRAFKV